MQLYGASLLLIMIYPDIVKARVQAWTSSKWCASQATGVPPSLLNCAFPDAIWAPCPVVLRNDLRVLRICSAIGHHGPPPCHITPQLASLRCYLGTSLQLVWLVDHVPRTRCIPVRPCASVNPLPQPSPPPPPPNPPLPLLPVQLGTIRSYLGSLPLVLSAWGARLACLSSLQELSVVDAARLGAPPLSVALPVEPSFVACGPAHVAAGMNNQVTFVFCRIKIIIYATLCVHGVVFVDHSPRIVTQSDCRNYLKECFSLLIKAFHGVTRDPCSITP